jgi:hypothetical protein
MLVKGCLPSALAESARSKHASEAAPCPKSLEAKRNEKSREPATDRLQAKRFPASYEKGRRLEPERSPSFCRGSGSDQEEPTGKGAAPSRRRLLFLEPKQADSNGHSANGVVAEARLRDALGVIKVPSIEDNGFCHQGFHAFKVRIAELVPFCDDG